VKEMSDDEKLLNMREARQYLNVGRSTIIRFMERGVLDGMKV
jgi:predicted DNA-binding transcriptional regulator AlpA